MEISLNKMVADTGESTDVGKVGITTAQIGVYSELEISGTTTSDIVRVLGKCVPL